MKNLLALLIVSMTACVPMAVPGSGGCAGRGVFEPGDDGGVDTCLCEGCWVKGVCVAGDGTQACVDAVCGVCPAPVDDQHYVTCHQGTCGVGAR